MSNIDTRVVANYQTAEYGKFVQLTNNTEFPAVSVTRFNSPNTPGLAPLSSVEVYPKFAVITYDSRLGTANALPFGDNGSLDAFGKLRVTTPRTLLDSKFITGKASYIFDEVLSGAATSTFVHGDSLVQLSTTNINDFAIRQTYTHFNYQPGKSIQAIFTGLFEPQSNIVKRIGLFQSASAAPYTPIDGVYLESSNNTVSFNILKTSGTPLHLSAAKADWNVDKLDGAGPSGLTIDFTKAQIITFDYEWLGLGRVRCGFMMGGKTYYVHYFENINSLTQPYMSSPNHPVRYEIRQTGSGSGVLKHICSTVIIEGGEENVGTSLTAELSGGISVDSTMRPLLAIRLNPQSVDLVGIIRNLNFYNTGNAPVHYKLIMNPTITGGTLNTYVSVDGFTDIQCAPGSASLSLSGGYEMVGGYVPNGNSAVAVGSNSQDVGGELARLGSKINGDPVVFVVAARTFSGTATSVYVTANLELRA
ncbi:MAG: hypothetical protein ACOVRN_05590 [Flavobacterium sp.]